MESKVQNASRQSGMVARSRRVYARLLYLYPQAHRLEYGADMLQVFTDQCREAHSGWQMVIHWLRTLFDLLISAAREHATSPHATGGLLEPGPSGPLPWKGVALVLLPGLIFFIAQVGQVTGKNWFYYLVARGAYYMIAPVVIVWVWKRKFPIWGLIPLGLLTKTLLDYIERLVHGFVEESTPLVSWAVRSLKPVPLETKWNVVMMALGLSLVVLLVLVMRQSVMTKRGLAWLGGFVVLLGIKIGAFYWVNFQQMQKFAQLDPYDRQWLWSSTISFLFDYGWFLALILVGGLLAKRHGRLAALLPMGYLLPRMLYGGVSDDWPTPQATEFQFMLAVASAVLVYRFIVSLAAPLWIVRSATQEKQSRASLISLLGLLVMEGGFHLAVMLSNGWRGGDWYNGFSAIDEPLILGTGILLAMTLYRAGSGSNAGQGEARRLLEEDAVS